MAIFNGFYAGLISGFLITATLILIFAMITTIQNNRKNEKMVEFLNSLDKAAKENIISMGDKKNESDD